MSEERCEGTYAYGKTARSPTATTVGLALNNASAVFDTDSADVFSIAPKASSSDLTDPDNTCDARFSFEHF